MKFAQEMNDGKITPARTAPEVMLPEFRMDNVEFDLSLLQPPCIADGEVGPFVYCYLLQRGRLELQVDLPEPFKIGLDEGDIVAIRGVHAHRFRTPGCPTSIRHSTLEHYSLDAAAGQTFSVELIRGRAPAESISHMGAVGGPYVMKAAAHPTIARRIWSALDLIRQECLDANELPWRDDIIRRLGEVICVNLTRLIIEQRMIGSAALIDARLMRALHAVTNDPLRRWTVKDLAAIAGMSRTAFAVRYSRVFGEPPVHNIARMRLRSAARRLRDGEQSVEEVALSSGYGTIAAFSRAFRREFKVAPSRWRDQRSHNLA